MNERRRIALRILIAVTILIVIWWLDDDDPKPPKAPAPPLNSISRRYVPQSNANCSVETIWVFEKWAHYNNIIVTGDSSIRLHSRFVILQNNSYVEMFYEPLTASRRPELILSLVPQSNENNLGLKGAWRRFELDALWINLIQAAECKPE